MNTRTPLHCVHDLSSGYNKQNRRRDCLKNFIRSRRTTQRQGLEDMNRLWEAYGPRVLCLEQTLAEYFCPSLRNDSKTLNNREWDRYLYGLQTSDGSRKRAEKAQAVLVSEHHTCAEPQNTDEEHILVVSNLLVWRFGGMFPSPCPIFPPLRARQSRQ